MSKYVIIGDLEGRTIWKDIIKKENPDIIVFLGDYVASRVSGIGPHEEIATLEELMRYKEANPNTVYLLRGNHDNEALCYYWARCSPSAHTKVKQWLSDNQDRFLNNTQWIYQIPNTNIVCSHAGISEPFLDKVCKYFKNQEGWDFNIYDTEQLLQHLNDIPPCSLFQFDGGLWDYYGDSDTQPCTWIRPGTLATCYIPDYIQVVGHTRTTKVTKLENAPIWMCDALDNNGYLVIENGEFVSKKF